MRSAAYKEVSISGTVKDHPCWWSKTLPSESVQTGSHQGVMHGTQVALVNQTEKLPSAVGAKEIQMTRNFSLKSFPLMLICRSRNPRARSFHPRRASSDPNSVRHLTQYKHSQVHTFSPVYHVKVLRIGKEPVFGFWIPAPIPNISKATWVNAFTYPVSDFSWIE